jgi:hypothetical protein
VLTGRLVQNLRLSGRVTVFASLVSLFAATHVVAQDKTRSVTSPILPPGHWAIVAAGRAAILGLTPAELGFGDGSLTQASAGRMLREATEQSVSTLPRIHTAIEADWRRFVHEFPGVAAGLDEEALRAPRRAGPIPFATSVDAGILAVTGRLLPVRSLDRTRENVAPPTPLADLDDADIELRTSALLTRYAAADLAAGRKDGSWDVHDWQVTASAHSLGAWVGKRAPDFGPGVGGSVVFDGRAAFTGGGAMLLNGIRLPWLLRSLGVFRGEAFLARIDSSAATRHPWLFASHLTLTPHPRLMLGATQAFMFSGEGLPPFTFRNFKEMFLTHGIKTAGREFENGIAAVEARWRVPLPRVPTVLYMEWGTDDNHGAWFKFPAVIAGVSLPSLPIAPTMSLGIERASFAAPCSSCGGCACEYYATWYRHYVFMDGWTLDRRPIGHPLGGDGTEWLAYARYDDWSRRTRLDVQGFTRDRGRYNLFSPAREGRSVGGRVRASYRLTSSFELHADAEGERGRPGWTASAVSVGARWVP